MKDQDILIIPQKWKTQDYTGFNERYPLIEPYTYARIKWDEKISKLVYLIEEPELSEVEMARLVTIQGIIQERVRSGLQKSSEKSELVDYLEKGIGSS